MPARPVTSHQAIVDAGRELLEREGLDGLTMQAVAAAVGVRAPSLYKRLRDRGELIRLISDATARDLLARLEPVRTGDPRHDLRALAQAFRAFAHERPAGYGLLFARLPEAWRVDPELNARAAGPILETARGLVGSEDALDAARLVVAWAHGFVSMELAGAFRLGGDTDQAFTYGIDQLTDALEPRAERQRRSRERPSRRPSDGRAFRAGGASADDVGRRGLGPEQESEPDPASAE